MKLTSVYQRIFFFLFLGLILTGSLLVVRPFWQLIVLAGIAASLSHPAYNWLAGKTQWKPGLVTAAIYLLLLAAVLIPIVIGLALIGNQAAQLSQAIQSSDVGVLAQLLDAIAQAVHKTLGIDLTQTINTLMGRFIEQRLGIDLQALINQMDQFIKQNLVKILAWIAGAAAGLVGSAVGLFFGFVVFTFYFVMMLPNLDRLKDFVVKLSPLDPDITGTYLRRVRLIIHDVMLGVFGVAAVMAIILWLVMVLLGIPFAGVIALFVFGFALIPFLGRSLVTIPLGIVLILFGQWVPALILWAVDLLVCNNIDLVLRPYITSKEIRRVHQAILLTGFMGGIPAFGLIGLFLGPMVVILLTTSLEIYLENYGQPVLAPSAEESASFSEKPSGELLQEQANPRHAA